MDHSFANTIDDDRSCTVTLQSSFGACEQLNSSDDHHGHELLGDLGLDPSGGEITGTVELSGITTVCCAE